MVYNTQKLTNKTPMLYCSNMGIIALQGTLSSFNFRGFLKKGMQKVIYGGVAVGIALIAVLILRVVISDVSETTNFVYHTLLADPEIYEDGAYSETFDIPAGDYKFRFIPNGDSPQMLSIDLNGKSFSFSEDFELDGTSHKSPISEYFTWDYLGQKEFQITEGQSLEIKIDPNGNTVGTVSVMIGRT